MTQEPLEKIVKQYDRECTSIERLTDGIVNDTWKVKTHSDAIIVQRLGAFSNEQVAEDYAVVQEHVGSRVPIATQLKTKDGMNYVRDNTGVWRAFAYVEHDNAQYDPFAFDKDTRIFKAAYVLGQLHRVFAEFDYEPGHANDWLHNQEAIVKKLTQAYNSSISKWVRVRKEFEFICEELSSNSIPAEPTQLIHGDPKLQNFLFRDGEVVAIIDFETIMRGNVLVDIGDGLRSMCKLDNTFNPARYQSFMLGYRTACDRKFPLGHDTAVRSITMQLAARFLLDYFLEEYFQWDKEKYSQAADAHLDKCKQIISYYQTLDFKDPHCLY